MKLFFSLTFIFQFVLLAPFVASATEYAASRGMHRGSARTIAMGGAFAGVSNDADGIWSNPAMILLQSEGLDVILTQSQALGTDYTIDDTGVKKGLRQEYQLINTTWSSDDYLLGFSTGSPYKEGSVSNYYLTPRLEIKDQRFVFGKKFGTWSLAGTFTDSLAEQEIIFHNQFGLSSDYSSFEKKSRAQGWGISLAKLMTEQWRWGITYDSSRTYNFDSNLPSWAQLLNQQRSFLNVRVPERWRLGSSYNFEESKILLSTELELMQGLGDLTSFIESMPITTQHRLSSSSQIWIPHLGAEWFGIDRAYFKTWLRAGVYYEPPVFYGMDQRFHRTIGFQAKTWIFSFSFAYDAADAFSHFSTSIGISLSDYI